jgi:two-component system LytT family response regulator
MPTARPLKVLVVDDEAPARRRLVDLLARVNEVGAILEAVDGTTAARMIGTDRPDAVFLDMQIPGPSGLDVVATVGADRMPVTVFVTAYDQYAIRAFEANALDYLLKPFSDERFEAAMRRVLGRLDQCQPARWDRLVVKSAGATHIVRTTDIDWIEAVGVYVNLYVGGKALLYRSPIHVLADKLDPVHFVRIHRSAIVNIDSIVRLEPLSHGEFDVVLKHGGRTKVSRTYRSQLEQRLGQAL